MILWGYYYIILLNIIILNKNIWISNVNNLT